jgi:hypothetical protein
MLPIVDSQFLAKKNMIITSLNTLKANKKRKNDVAVHDPSIKHSKLQSSSKIKKASPTDTENNELLSFNKIYVPDPFLSNYEPKATVKGHWRTLDMGQHIAETSEPILDDWWLEENAYTNESSKNVKPLSPKEKGISIPLVEPETLPPGLTPHPHHHRKHELNDISFSCDPDVPPQYAEAVYAGSSNITARSMRPQYRAAPPHISQTLLSDRITDESNNMEDSKMSDNDSPSQSLGTVGELNIFGKSVDIRPLSIASGSVALGINWTPAPHKFSLPLKLYHNVHSIANSSRSESRMVFYIIYNTITLFF